MTDIKLDMFEVQLGAAILLSFEVEGRNVKVLADAGVKPALRCRTALMNG